MKVWITKGELKDGILFVKDAKYLSLPSKDSILIKSPYDLDLSIQVHNKNKDWHTSEENAMNYMEKLREKKIESLKKKIKEIKLLEIKVYQHKNGVGT